MMRVINIARLTLEEARRKRVAAAALVLGLAFLLLFGIGFRLVLNEVVASAARARGPVNALQTSSMIGFFGLAGLYAANFLGVMMSALLPVDTLAGEIRSGAIQTLLTKPVLRADVLLGKWLGFWVLLMAYLLLIAGGVVAIVTLLGGQPMPNVAEGIALMMLESTVVLTLCILFGTRLGTLATGVCVFGLFGLAFIGGWIERIGSLFGNNVAEQIGIVTSLLVPTEVLWQRAAWVMQPPLLSAVGVTPFSSASEPSVWMVAWAVGYIVAMLALAVRWFNGRDI